MKPDSKGLALPKTLTDLLDHRERGLAGVRALAAAMEQGKKIPGGLPDDFARVFSDTKQWIKEMDVHLWRSSMDVSGMSEFMDAKARNAFTSSLESPEVPEFNEDNLRATFMELLPRREMMFQRGLVEVFKRLSPEYSRHQDAAFKMPRRVILKWMTREAFWAKGGRSLRYDAEGEINDIDRVLHRLAGEKFNPRELFCAINERIEKGEPYAGRWFKLKAYKNGNVHLEWTDPEMLNKVNGIIADYYGDRAVGAGRAA